MIIFINNPLRGHCTPNLKLAYFVCYLKIINTFFLEIIYCPRNSKNGFEILVGQAVF